MEFGDGNSSTSTAPNHTYSDTGTYTVCLIVTNSCGSDTLCKTVLVPGNVGIEETILKKQVKIFPNPTLDYLYIDVSKLNFKNFRISLHSIEGKKLKTRLVKPNEAQSLLELSTENLPSGIYILEMNADGNRWFEKIVKN